MNVSRSVVKEALLLIRSAGFMTDLDRFPKVMYKWSLSDMRLSDCDAYRCGFEPSPKRSLCGDL